MPRLMRATLSHEGIVRLIVHRYCEFLSDVGLLAQFRRRYALAEKPPFIDRPDRM